MRTAMKTGTYGVMHFVVAVAVTYALTRNWQAALAIGMIEPLFQTLGFVVHDRLWARADARRMTSPAVSGV